MPENKSIEITLRGKRFVLPFTGCSEGKWGNKRYALEIGTVEIVADQNNLDAKWRVCITPSDGGLWYDDSDPEATHVDLETACKKLDDVISRWLRALSLGNVTILEVVQEN